MNLGVKVLIGFTVVSSFLGGPFILKLTPKTPSPVFEPTNILSIKDTTPMPHNGARPPKRRRV